VSGSCKTSILIVVLWAVAGIPAAAQSLLLRPEYSSASVASAASNRAGRIAPNTIISIYGANLSLFTWAISPQELLRGFLPTATTGGAVYVQLQGRRLPLFYVSPQQINALVPADVLPGVRGLEVYRELVAGPEVSLVVDREAPELFRMPDGMVAATHVDGRVVTADTPAEPGEFVVVYGTGFGALKVSEVGVVVPTRPSEVVRAREYRVRIDGQELAAGAIYYVGVTPGFAGLYQMNVRMPSSLPENPRIEIGVGDNWSASDLRIAARKTQLPD
jgi:uncharacterized protein (TIGR03437 family)